MIKYELSLSQLAVEDVNEAILWYKEQQQGLELSFLSELRNSYEKIIVYPEMYGFYRIATRFRYTKLKRFPYYILFIVDGNIIRITGIVHTSRSPQFVRRRY